MGGEGKEAVWPTMSWAGVAGAAGATGLGTTLGAAVEDEELL